MSLENLIRLLQKNQFKNCIINIFRTFNINPKANKKMQAIKIFNIFPILMNLKELEKKFKITKQNTSKDYKKKLKSK